MVRLILVTVGLIFSFIPVQAFVSTQEVSFTSPSSGRTLVAEIYYPSLCNVKKKKIQHGIWLRGNYSKGKNCKNNQQKYPLILFSHGFQGDRFGNSWIAEALVDQGYIVVMVDHTLNTSYEHSDLFLYTSMWQRPLDISEVLTYLLDHPKWGPLIHTDQIAVAGFSLGGATALWLSGITADPDQFRRTMDEKYSRWSDWPRYAQEKAKSVDWAKAEKSYKDARIKAVIAIAPDLGQAFTKDGLKKADVPILIIVGDQDRITPKKENAAFYAKGIKGADLEVIPGAEHFTFMKMCCSSEDKKKHVHGKVIHKIYAFLQKTFLQKNS